MSRKSASRRASNARAYAFASSPPSRNDPLETMLAKHTRMREEAAIILGYESLAQMDAENDARRLAEQRLPPEEQADRSYQYLVTQMLRERDGNHCYLCRRDMTGLKGVVEHMIPLSRGGTNEPSNVALSCPDCNSRKGTNYVSFGVLSGDPMYHPPRT